MSNSPQGREEAGRQVFDWVRSLGIHRREDAWVGGVFSALADRLGWDTALVRGLGVVAFILFSSPMALFYGIAWLLLPDRKGAIHAQEALRGSYPAGFWGAAVVTFIGAVNVFTPNIVGPFAILLNLVIIAVVAAVLWAIFRSYQNNRDKAPEDGSPKARPSTGAPSESEDESPAEGAQRPAREDGKPAWYPKEGPEPATPMPSGSTTPHSSTDGTESSESYGYVAGLGLSAAEKYSQQEQDPREREENRRRRLVSFGLLLLAIPMIAGAMWVATSLGLATTNAVLLGLAAVVTLLALTHLWSAVRGTKGRAGLLATFTTLMMVVFLFAPANFGDSSNHVFGNYTTSSTEVNSAFSNTTVDLRDVSGGTAVDLNNAFGNTTVIVPDEAAVTVDPNNFLGNVDVRTLEMWEEYSGVSTSDFSFGPEDPELTVELSLNNAFANVTIYDETTYLEEEQDTNSDADEEAGPARGTDAESRVSGIPTPGAPAESDRAAGNTNLEETR